MSLPALNQAQSPATMAAGGRRLDTGFLRDAELGGGFTALPAVLTVTSDYLYVAGLNAFMAVVNSSAGGNFVYSVSWYNPPRPFTDPLFLVPGTIVVGTTVHSWGMGALAYNGSPFALMRLSWINRLVPGSTLNSIRLYGLARP